MIYIVKHKECDLPKLPGYTQLGVGKIFNHKGDNINYLNPYLNETTALYDIWKNTDEKIVGICHYRRFFEKDRDYLQFKDAEKALKEHDIIVTKDYMPPVTPYYWLSQAITTHTLDKYIPKLPDDFQEWLHKPQSYNICNMFVCKQNILDFYCRWLFPIMIPLADQFMQEDSGKNPKDDRALGFICEMMFGFWCKGLDKYKLDVKMIEV